MDTLILYLVVAICLAWSFMKSREKTRIALKKARKSFENILPQFLVVLILVALCLSVFDTETISLVLGKDAGVWAVLAASLVGAITLIPGFVAFPAAVALMQGGAGTVQIAAFVSSLMMVGVVTLPLEIKYFGRRAALLLVIPPIFVLLGLLDVWVPRERMIRFMGEGAGVKGLVLAFLLGSFARRAALRRLSRGRRAHEKGREFYQHSYLYRCLVNHQDSHAAL